jgi:hypothetical protein
VTPAANRGEQPVSGGEAYRAGDIGGSEAAHDERRVAIEGGIPQTPRGIVAGLFRRDELAAQPRAQVLDVGGLQRELASIEADGANVAGGGGDEAAVR